jgi:hypothetical protein
MSISFHACRLFDNTCSILDKIPMADFWMYMKEGSRRETPSCPSFDESSRDRATEMV